MASLPNTLWGSVFSPPSTSGGKAWEGETKPPILTKLILEDQGFRLNKVEETSHYPELLFFLKSSFPKPPHDPWLGFVLMVILGSVFLPGWFANYRAHQRENPKVEICLGTNFRPSWSDSEKSQFESSKLLHILHGICEPHPPQNGGHRLDYYIL